MATYDNQYAIKITPNTSNLRGLTTNYSNDGQRDLGGTSLGDIYQLDYDRNAIEKIFRQGTDAKYDLMQRKSQIAENNFANQQFASQQSALEALRAQRNEQIASGMSRGLSAAADQATVLGIQQDNAAAALELANNRQTQADQIAADYAQNVIDAMKESNSVKEAMASIAATLYEADMMGYTGELSAAAQMDANASNRYMGELDSEAQRYAADKNYAAAVQSAQIQAAATKAAAQYTASKYSSGSTTNEYHLQNALEEAYKIYGDNAEAISAYISPFVPNEKKSDTAAREYIKVIQGNTNTNNYQYINYGLNRNTILNKARAKNQGIIATQPLMNPSK